MEFIVSIQGKCFNLLKHKKRQIVLNKSLPFFVLLLIGSTLFAQQNKSAALQKVIESTNVELLDHLSEKWEKQFDENYQKAIEIARENNIPIKQIRDDGTVVVLVGIDHFGNLQFDQSHNLNSQISMSTDDVQPGGGSGFALDGNGMIIGLWEAGGHPRHTHQQFNGRVTRLDSDDTTSHATHVCGTLIGDGTGNANAEGMAPAATVRAYNAGNDASEMASEAALGLLISNHSYGAFAGWDQDNGGNWHWYGNTSISTTESHVFGYYGPRASTYDSVAAAAPFYLICRSAGNDRNDFGPANGTAHTHNGAGNFNDNHPSDCNSGTGFDCLPERGNAKNILTVSAVNDVIGGYSGPGSVTISNFSGWGPTDDGRVKPDISANGVSLTSSDFQSNTSYSSKSGTSMSSPSVAGSCALLQELYLNENGAFMRSSTIKALVIHTADEAGPADGPDYQFGWGMMNTLSAAQLIDIEGDGFSEIRELTLADDETDSWSVDATGCSPLVVTLCWTDPPANGDAQALDVSTSKLINDLDLRLSKDGSTWMPYVLNPASPNNAATSGDNVRDNVEKIVIESPEPGSYTIQVSHKGALAASQAYSVIVSGISDEAPLSTSAEATSDFNGYDISCHGACDGEATVTPSEGIPPYDYKWDFNSGNQTTATAVGLCASTFYVTVTDAIGCESINSVTLTEPDELEASTLVVSDYNGWDVSCYGACDGSAEANQSGGVASYTYKWSLSASGQTTKVASNLCAGYHYVTVTDANGCTASSSVSLNEPPPLSLEAGENQTVYFGYPDSACAQLEASGASGGVPPYSISWSTGENTDDINVCPDSTTIYYATVTDQNGCTFTDSVKVCVIDVRCGKNLDKILICHKTMANDSSSNSMCIGFEAAKKHILVHGDQLATCGTDKSCDFVSEGAKWGINGTYQDQVELGFVANIFPNPFESNTTVKFMNSEDDIIDLRIIDMTGKTVIKLFQGRINAGQHYTFKIEGNELSSGLYLCVYNLQRGESRIDKLIMTR